MLEDILALLGQEAILLPVSRKAKSPSLSDWNKLDLSCMSDPEHLESLTRGNIGVLLGTPSAGLCTIDVDDDDQAEAFLALNPQLQDTLQTRGCRGRNFWVRLDGEYPPLSKLVILEGTAWGEFRSTGGQTVISGEHPKGMPYQYICKKPPVRLRFEDLRWPQNLKLPWIKDPFDILTEKEGPLIDVRAKGTARLNNKAMAEKLIMENNFDYDRQEKNLYQYDPERGVYSVAGEELQDFVSQEIKRVADEAGCEDLTINRNNHQIASIVDSMKAKLARTRPCEPEAIQNAIVVKNGVLELTPEGGVLASFHPRHRGRNRIPIDFDPEAACCRFLNEVLRPVLSADDIEVLQTYMGSVLLGRNTSQRILVLCGPAGSGKSTVVEIIERLIGLENTAELRMDHLDGRFEMYSARNATLLTGKDVRSDFLGNKTASMLKKLSGGDAIRVEQKGGASFDVAKAFHVIITSNTKLTINLDRDIDAWNRRLVLIEFQPAGNRPVVPEFAQVLLKEEASGILAFFVEGARKFLEHGVTLSQEQRNKTYNMLLESDSIRSFAETGVEAIANSSVQSLELYAHYLEFCESRSWAARQQSAFLKEIGGHLFELYRVSCSHDIGTKRGYRGIRIK
ncbi:MAG: hypothetical protein BGO12_02075 [Verrucomicrobia bacterium 61-8]|nr:MAG: hypothetical protein BGO12_02075 [Verrucomicrobia bacterium 61-8]